MPQSLIMVWHHLRPAKSHHRCCRNFVVVCGITAVELLPYRCGNCRARVLTIRTNLRLRVRVEEDDLLASGIMGVLKMNSGEIVPFYEICPDQSERMRAMTVRNHPSLPDNDYGLVDAFCADPDCDCRIVYIFVVSTSRPGILASITFGWEPLDFYRKWMGLDQVDDVVRDLKGPALMPMAQQTEFSNALLELVVPRLKEPSYVELLKQHYWRFKDALRAGGPVSGSVPSA